MFQELKRLLCLYYQKLYIYILQQPAGSLQLSGVLGLAAVVIAWNFVKRNGATGGTDGQRRRSSQHHGVSGTSSAAGLLAAGSSSSAKTVSDSSNQGQSAGLSPVRSKLAGVRKVTISSLGCLTEQWTIAELQEGATLRREAVDILREACSCTDTYIVTQVQDDIGQAVLLGSLEAAGLVGSQPGQVQPHHLLFCSTMDGKVSTVRQLEPDLHIDGSAKTIDDLKRFMPRLLHITQPGTAAAGQGSSNVTSSKSLQSYFS